MKRLAFAALALACMSSPALAQYQPSAGQLPSPEDIANRDTLTLAGGVGIIPDYEGSDEYRIIPVAAARGQYHGISFTTRGLYLYVDAVPRSGNVEFDAGPIIGMRLNKRNHVDDDVIDALPNLDSAFEIGGFAGVSIHGVTNPYDTLAFRFDVTHDIGDAHESTVISPNVEFSTPLSRTTYVGASIGAEFVANKFADYYFSISPADSLATGGILPVYDADGGMKNWKIGLLLNQSLSGDLLHGWSLFGLGQYSHLVGDFKDSPIVDDRGNAGQWVGAAGVAYTW